MSLLLRRLGWDVAVSSESRGILVQEWFFRGADRLSGHFGAQQWAGSNLLVMSEGMSTDINISQGDKRSTVVSHCASWEDYFGGEVNILVTNVTNVEADLF